MRSPLYGEPVASATGLPISNPVVAMPVASATGLPISNPVVAMPVASATGLPISNPVVAMPVASDASGLSLRSVFTIWFEHGTAEPAIVVEPTSGAHPPDIEAGSYSDGDEATGLPESAEVGCFCLRNLEVGAWCMAGLFCNPVMWVGYMAWVTAAVVVLEGGSLQSPMFVVMAALGSIACLGGSLPFILLCCAECCQDSSTASLLMTTSRR